MFAFSRRRKGKIFRDFDEGRKREGRICRVSAWQGKRGRGYGCCALLFPPPFQPVARYAS